jgi:hypothetical protein
MRAVVPTIQLVMSVSAVVVMTRRVMCARAVGQMIPLVMSGRDVVLMILLATTMAVIAVAAVAVPMIQQAKTVAEIAADRALMIAHAAPMLRWMTIADAVEVADVAATTPRAPDRHSRGSADLG